MTNAITSFQQFHQTLTSIANNPAIGVVPTIVNGAPSFVAIGEQLARAPSPVQIDFLRPRPEFDAKAFARAHDDSALLDEINSVKGVLGARLGDLLPDRSFFGFPTTKVQAERRDRIKRQVTDRYVEPGEELQSDASKFGGMTVETIARRLATKSYLQGGGHGHMDLIHALLDRSHMLGSQGGSQGAPRDELIAAGIMLANINSSHALAMAEFALGEAALKKDFVGAAILLGLAADVRDMRAGGVEPDNPFRAIAAMNWAESIKKNNRDSDISARVFFGMSEALRTADYELYAEFAEQGSKMLVSKIDRRIGTPYLARYLWAKSENINRQGETAEVDDEFWVEMEEGLSDVGESFHHGRGAEGMKLSAECWALSGAIKLMLGV